MTPHNTSETSCADLPASLRRLEPILKGPLFEGWTRNPLLQSPVARRVNLSRWRLLILDMLLPLSVGVLFVVFSSQPLIAALGAASVVLLFSSLFAFVTSPLPPIPLMTGISPFSKDLWSSGVRLRDIVQAVAVHAYRWRWLDFVYLLAIPTCAAIWSPLFVSVAEPKVFRKALQAPGGWIQLGLLLAICGMLSVFLLRNRSEIRLYFQLRWLQKLAGQPDMANWRRKKASEVDILALPYVSHFYPLLPGLYWPLFGGLLSTVFPGPDEGYLSRDGIVAILALLIFLGLPLMRFGNLQRRIDARVQWLLTTGEEEFNRRMREKFGDSI